MMCPAPLQLHVAAAARPQGNIQEDCTQKEPAKSCLHPAYMRACGPQQAVHTEGERDAIPHTLRPVRAGWHVAENHQHVKTTDQLADGLYVRSTEGLQGSTLAYKWSCRCAPHCPSTAHLASTTHPANYSRQCSHLHTCPLHKTQ